MLLGEDGLKWWEIHGVGLEAAEGAPEILRAGMVVAFEPIFSVDGQGFYLEDMILVTKDGHEILTPGLPYSALEDRARRRADAELTAASSAALFAVAPGPSSARPAGAPVGSPSLSTCTPLTNTCAHADRVLLRLLVGRLRRRSSRDRRRRRRRTSPASGNRGGRGPGSSRAGSRACGSRRAA